MKKDNCNKYVDAKLPPCANFLGNNNPIIKNGKLIFRNMNRLYYFIATSPKTKNSGKKKVFTTPQLYTNIQISLTTYIIGLFIDMIEKEKIIYDKEYPIHSNKEINDYIHQTIAQPPDTIINYQTQLTLVYSNGNAILTPIQYTVDISSTNYLILLTINRLESDPGLLFINNSYATPDIINLILSEIDINFPYM